MKLMLNLDYECMKYAQEISKISDSNLENNLRKALGVLQEDGVYAMFLWLESKEGKNIRKILIRLLNESEIRKYLLTNSSNFPEDFSKFCEKLREIAQDIDKLLFVKKLLERTLIYALYHTKIGE
ncbi:MAG: hypothetical protein N2V77_05540 [Canidatus Methanoxibalbensis ujae]|nr:hypothetical protein [Candidatus Methanoxibalbensis ujae]